jgi:uncharacterized protein
MKYALNALFFVLIVSAVLAAGPDDLLATLSKPITYVNDYAGVFSGTDKDILENFLREAQSKTTAEIAVVALKSMEGGEINDFANRLKSNSNEGRRPRPWPRLL